MPAASANAAGFTPALAAIPPETPTLPGYLTRQETVCGSGADLQMRLLLDRQQFFDPLGEAERAGISPSNWPLFGLLWPSGRVLAHVMQSFDLDGKHILELGCGLGLASLVVHRRGGDITASDNHPLAGAFLLENLKLNLLPAMKYHSADWATPNLKLERFDLIIGSDVLYDRGQPQALSDFIDRHATAAAQILIVDPDRGNRVSFTRKMDVLGYSHTQTRLTVLPDGGAYKGRLLSYIRAAPVIVEPLT